MPPRCARLRPPGCRAHALDTTCARAAPGDSHQWDDGGQVGLALPGAHVHFKHDEGADHCVEPSARLDRVEAHHDDLKLAVPFGVLILDWTVVSLDGDARHAFHDKVSRDCRLWTAHVCLPEQELAVEVGDIDGVHIDDIEVTKPRESEVLQQFASEPPGADDEHTRMLLHEGEDVGRWLERQRRVKDGSIVADVCEEARSRQELR
eukprot:scaffold33026_cov129-Isochrysis_galbana.AAC.3